MSKVRTFEIDPKERKNIIGNFFEIVSELKTKKEIIDFFIGLLTSSEAIMLARRIQIAQMIIEGKNYEEIRFKLKVGFDTISKTEKWLNGENLEYNKWIRDCLVKNIVTTKSKQNFKKQGSLLNKYAHHRLIRELFN